MPLFRVVCSYRFRVATRGVAFISGNNGDESTSTITTTRGSVVGFSSQRLEGIGFNARGSFNRRIFLGISVSFLGVVDMAREFRCRGYVSEVFCWGTPLGPAVAVLRAGVVFHQILETLLYYVNWTM